MLTPQTMQPPLQSPPLLRSPPPVGPLPVLLYGLVPPPPLVKDVEIQTDIQIVGRSGWPFEEDAEVDAEYRARFRVCPEVRNMFGEHMCQHAIGWMRDRSIFGSVHEQQQTTWVFTMRDLPEFMQYLCSSRDELEHAKEWSYELSDELDKRDALQHRLELMKKEMPGTASLLADGGWFDRRLQHQLQEMRAMRACRATLLSANPL